MGYNGVVASAVAEEGIVRMIKVVSLVYRKKGINNKQFLSYWLDKHGPLAVENIPGVLHYTQNHPIATPGAPDDADGITEMWFEDMESSTPSVSSGGVLSSVFWACPTLI